MAIPLDETARARIGRAFARARRRTLLLDYDGTLREVAERPELAAPTAEIRRLLLTLSALPATTVHLVSGRPRETMTAWFGELPLVLCAEHGYLLRTPGSDWRATVELDLSWLPAVERVLRRAAARVPGAFVERKEASVAWHYRQVEPASAERALDELLAELEPILRGIPAELLRGRRALEVRARGVDKGRYVRTLFPAGKSARGEFVLAAGDDRTDLDLYRSLPSGAIALHVDGARLEAPPPRGAFAVDSPRALRALLRTWADEAEEGTGTERPEPSPVPGL